ncbi:uncharacterized protein PG998_006286 [Apiospora kogelbergensis]|uniref:uncharacterized protein n=1 Tax=Apiospora kogelbergensis TaxID=1337665 RepID=UPI00312EFAA8
MKAFGVPGPRPQRGFGAVGQERTAKHRKENLAGHDSWDKLKDEREYFDMGPPEDLEFPNVWPDEADIPGFRRRMESYWNMFEDVALQIISAIEMGLGLPPNALMARCRPSTGELRMNHYPSVSLETLAKGEIKRTWPHVDLGVITLLIQDTVGGLEIADIGQGSPENPSFVAVEPRGNGTKVNVVLMVGATLQRWTNGLLPGTLHQVSLPAPMRQQRNGDCPERFSGAFFLKANKSASVAPLEQFITSEQPVVWDNMSALEFTKRMVEQLY